MLHELQRLELIHIRPENEEQNVSKIQKVWLKEETDEHFIAYPENTNVREPLTYPKFAWVRCVVVGGIVYDVNWEGY